MSRERGFTIVEVLISIVLLIAITASTAFFISGLADRRKALVEAENRQIAIDQMFDSLSQAAVSTFVADRSGAGLVGNSSGLRVRSRALQLVSTGGAQSGGDILDTEIRHVGGILRLKLGDVEEPITIQVAKARVRYFDGRSWLAEFDSRGAGGLPAAIELDIWFNGIADSSSSSQPAESTSSEPTEFDEELPIAESEDLSEWPSPDRRIVIAIPDARPPEGQTVGGGGL